MISSRWSRDDITLSKFWLIEALWWSGRAQRRLAPRRGGPYGGRVVSAGFGRLAQLLTSSTSHQVWMKFKNFKKGLWMSLEHFQTRSWKSSTTAYYISSQDVQRCKSLWHNFPLTRHLKLSPHCICYFCWHTDFLKVSSFWLSKLIQIRKKKNKRMQNCLATHAFGGQVKQLPWSD